MSMQSTLPFSKSAAQSRPDLLDTLVRVDTSHVDPSRKHTYQGVVGRVVALHDSEIGQLARMECVTATEINLRPLVPVCFLRSIECEN